VQAVHTLIDNLDEHHAPIAASAMAFDAFLSLVPLAAFAGYILGRLHESGDLLLGPLVKTAPLPVRQLVDQSLHRLADVGNFLAPVSLIAFLWVSSAGISTAMYVFETMFHSPPRPWWWRRLIAMACVLGAVAGVALVTTIAIMLVTALGPVGGALIAGTVPTVSLIGLLCAFFRIAIRGQRPLRRRYLPGAVVTLALWAVTSALFSYYVSTLSRYTTLYGGLAAVAIFLFWLWLLALALLLGGEVNAQLEGIRGETPLSVRINGLPPPSPSPAPAPTPTISPKPVSPKKSGEDELDQTKKSG